MAYSIDYRGFTFRRLHHAPYFCCRAVKLEESLLHRQIWVDHHGEIPEGMIIHHKDGDFFNNSIDNLEMMTQAEHARGHGIERAKTPEGLEQMREAAAKAQQAWAGTRAALTAEERGAITKKGWEHRQPIQKTCLSCGATFSTFQTNRGKYCSKACGMRESRKRNATSPVNCSGCGEVFYVIPSRAEKAKYCSAACMGVGFRTTESRRTQAGKYACNSLGG